MALSAAAVRPSWNPLRCGGTALPTNLLLMAKLIAPLLSRWAEAAAGSGPAACLPVSTGVRPGTAGA